MQPSDPVNVPVLTPEQEADVQSRIESFKKEYKELVQNYQVDVNATPHMIPAGPYLYGVAIGMEYIDLKYRNPSPILSPLNNNESPQATS